MVKGKESQYSHVILFVEGDTDELFFKALTFTSKHTELIKRDTLQKN